MGGEKSLEGRNEMVQTQHMNESCQVIHFTLKVEYKYYALVSLEIKGKHEKGKLPKT